MKELITGLILFFLLSFPVHASKVSNEMIYQKLLELERKQAIMEAEFRVFREQVDKRFELIDKRFGELREDMNKRFEEMDKKTLLLKLHDSNTNSIRRKTTCSIVHHTSHFLPY